MNESEQITQGEWFGQIKTNQQYPELSLEEKYAQRIGVQLQDKIEFDIQGVPLTGIVTSLRKVRWTSFQPNFFIIVQPGFLEDAPQTFVALLKNFDKEILLQFEKEWLAKNANVSVIDVAQVFSAAQKMVKGAQQAILLMFFLLSLTVSLVLGSILIIQSESQKKEVELLSFLGVPTSMGKISIFYEYCILLFFGILVVSLSTWGLGFIFINLWD
jgi:putative ABC transport system permease protein